MQCPLQLASSPFAGFATTSSIAIRKTGTINHLNLELTILIYITTSAVVQSSPGQFMVTEGAHNCGSSF